MTTKPKFNIMYIFAVIAILLIALIVMQTNDKNSKSNFERAADDISDGVSDAADEFKEKGPVEKVGDAIEDAGQDIKDSID